VVLIGHHGRLLSLGVSIHMAGRITALKVQKKNRDRVSVYLDGRFALGLPAIVAATLKPGQILSDAEITVLEEDGAAEGAYNSALNYLSYRPRSRAEVFIYLQRRGVTEGQTEAVISRLERAGLLDDEDFARFWVDNRERFRPRGPRALRYELRGKGINEEIIDQAVAAVDAADSAYRAAAMKVRQWRDLDPLEFKKKVVAYLARRGFAYGVAREAADQHWAELTTEEG
jgi:regulatory protein